MLKEILRLEAENAHRRQRIEQQRSYQTQVFEKGKRAIFRALPTLTNPSSSYTGTVFKIDYNGRPEIYGVIAAHSLKLAPQAPGMVGKNFAALVEQEENATVVQGEVVEVSSAQMGDIALVKFPAEAEQYFDPVELANDPQVFPAQAYSQGYACNLLAHQVYPLTGTTSTGTLKGTLPAARNGDRAGFCGSPVFNDNFKLTGVHVGSSYVTQTGYVAPASLLRKAVEAYHHPQAKPIEVYINNTPVAELAMNEFVSNIELLDEHQHVLWEKNVTGKFSMSAVNRLVREMPGIAWIRLSIGHTHWVSGKQGMYLLNDASAPRIVLAPIKTP